MTDPWGWRWCYIFSTSLYLIIQQYSVLWESYTFFLQHYFSLTRLNVSTQLQNIQGTILLQYYNYNVLQKICSMNECKCSYLFMSPCIKGFELLCRNCRPLAVPWAILCLWIHVNGGVPFCKTNNMHHVMILLHHYMTLQPKWPQFESSSLWKPHILHQNVTLCLI